MDTFNLNSELYNDEEIETLFNLKKPYTQSDILKAKDVLLKQLISNKSLGPEKQREISFFIDTITLVNGGSGYTSPPTITVSPFQGASTFTLTISSGSGSSSSSTSTSTSFQQVVDNDPKLILLK